MTTHVYILTWCRDVTVLYGSLLTFKTLRTGFPNAIIHVLDNDSNPLCRPHIQKATRSVDGIYEEFNHEIPHYRFLEINIDAQSKGRAVFIDPDVCFWRKVEDWDFNSLMAGRYIPEFQCEYTKTLTQPRLHTSFLCIPDVARLKNAITTLKKSYFEFQPFTPQMIKMRGEWRRFDTGASLYAALAPQMHGFSEDQLNSYDHLFCGSHLDMVAETMSEPYAERMKELHLNVQRNHKTLRGAWREQDQYFEYCRANL